MMLIGVLLLGIAGCSDGEVPAAGKASQSAPGKVAQSTNRVPRSARGRARPSRRIASATNNVEEALSRLGATPDERVHIKACIAALDDGHDAFAMRHAREFMDSTNVEVRLQAVEVFGWIGRFAVKELAEMMADADEEVSSEALRQWEMAFDEYSSDVSRMKEIERAANLLKDQHSLEIVMVKLGTLEEHNAVMVLSDIISSTNAAPIAAEVARMEYRTLTGEPFVDAKRAEQVAKTLKDRAEGLAPEQPKGQTISAKTQIRSRVPRGQGKEKK